MRLLPLIAVRAGFTLVQYGCFVAVLGLWPEGRAAAAATAIGASAWLFAVARSGPEKAALLLLPRTRRLGADLLSHLRPLIVLIPVPFAAATAVCAVARPGAVLTLWLAGGTYYLALGANLVGVAVHRALGRPGRDLADYAALTVGPPLFTLLVWRYGLGPLGYLAGQAVYVWLLTLTLLRGMDVPSAPTRLRASVGRLLAGNMVLLSVADVLMNAGTSLLYALLWVSGKTGQGDDLYRVGQGWAVVISFSFFLQRIFQPRASVRLAGVGAAGGVARAVRFAWAATALSACWLVVVGAVLVTGGFEPGLGGLVLMMVTRAPAFLLMSYSTYLLENSGAVRTSATSAAAGFLTVAAAGAAAVPLFGAAGAVFALGAKELVTGPFILVRSAKRRKIRQNVPD